MSYTGVIIEESLKDTSILKGITVVTTRVETVTNEHQTPWLKQWTLHTVEIPEKDADAVAEKLSHALDTRDNWYADFRNNRTHFIVFRDKVFRVDRSKQAQYEAVKKYGIAQGVPDYQLDFSPEIKEWGR